MSIGTGQNAKDGIKGNVLIRSKVTPYIEEIRGGAGKLMMNLALALSESGWNVTILSPQPHTTNISPRPKQEMLHYEEFNYKNPTNIIERLLGSVRGRREYSSIIKKRDIDIVIDDISHLPFYPAHFNNPNSIKNVVFLHTALLDAARESSKWYKAPIIEFVDRTLPYLNRPEIICAGPSTEARIRAHLDYDNTHIIRPYANVEDYQYNFDPTAKQILYLGRITKRKNIRCLLDAWEEIETQYPEYQLIVAGDGETRQDLIDYKRDLGLENVDFPGFVSDERKKQLFEESLLYVTPSLKEGYLTSGLEALAAGTPVVGTDTHGINDYIEDGKNGVLFPRDDSEALAMNLSNLFENPTKIRRLSEEGIKTADEHKYEHFKKEANKVIGNIYR